MSFQRDMQKVRGCWKSTVSAGDAMSAYTILRAFSWQLCLSPVLFEELCAALVSGQPTALADEMFVCLLRGLAHDENREARARRLLDLGSLDHVTWPEYVWEWLRLSHNPLSCLRSLAEQTPPAQVGCLY